MEVQPKLPLVALQLTFRTAGLLRLPPHAGFAWRGAFGHALKRTVCAMRMRPCEGCMLASSCVYPYVFATRPPETTARMSRYDQVPRPFALRSGTLGGGLIEVGGQVALTITVLGNVCRHLAYIVRAMEVAGQQGLGAGRTRLTLLQVEEATLEGCRQDVPPIYVPGADFHLPVPAAPEPPPCPDHVDVDIVTPLRLKEGGDLVTPDRFAARHLLANLIRRISMLMYFHTDTPLEADFRRLKSIAATVAIRENDLHWRELTRNSARQRTLMQMGGLVGSFTADLRGGAAVWPYLWLGQFTQAGKGTTMGLGAYRIVT